MSFLIPQVPICKFVSRHANVVNSLRADVYQSWVESTLQPQEQTWRHDIYHADQSKIKKGYTWNISYGDHSSAYGDVYVDRGKRPPASQISPSETYQIQPQS